MPLIGILVCFGLLHLIAFLVASALISKWNEDSIKFWEAIVSHIIAFPIAGFIVYAIHSVSYDLDRKIPENKISIDDYLPIVGAKYECVEVKGKIYKIKVNVYSSMNSSEIEVSKDTYDNLTIGSIYFKGGDKVASYVIPINGTTPVKKE